MIAAEVPSEYAVLNGQKYLHGRCTLVLGLSPGNPYYYKRETLEKLLRFAETTSDKVLFFVPDKISEHSYRAIGSKNPERSARVEANRLRNKCKAVMKELGCLEGKHEFVKWAEEIESCPDYTRVFQAISNLYQTNNEFRFEVQESSKAALIPKIAKSRENGIATAQNTTSPIDLEEGVKYLLNELTFFELLPKVYSNCEEFVLVYHRPWPVLEKYFGGSYDGIAKPSLGYVVFH